MVAIDGVRVVAVALESRQQAIECGAIKISLAGREAVQRADIALIVKLLDL